MCFLRQLWWTPCSADPMKIGQDVLKSGSLIWRLQFNSTPLTIRHWHIFQNAPCLPPPPPKKKLCISIVFSFSYDGCNTKEKWKKRKEKESVTQNWGEPFKVHKHVKKMSKALLRCQVRVNLLPWGASRTFPLMSRFARSRKSCDFSCVAKNRKSDDFSR